MTETDRIKVLRIALLLVGLTFTFGIWPLGIVWPSGWVWHEGGRSEYLEMILGIYATLGVFLMIASRDPMAHRSLIWFAVWSSIVHGVIMAAQSLAAPQHIGHLWGDAAALIAVAIVLAVLTPRQAPATSRIPASTRQSAALHKPHRGTSRCLRDRSCSLAATPVPGVSPKRKRSSERRCPRRQGWQSLPARRSHPIRMRAGFFVE